mgnify:CR=1 FL=1
MAKLTWQDKRPYNLYDFNKPTAIKTFSYKVFNKLKREAKQISGNPYIQRNWELQFLGEDNRKQLENLLNESKLSDLIPEGIISTYIDKFYNKNALQNAHALNMLLVLAKFNQTQNNG